MTTLSMLGVLVWGGASTVSHAQPAARRHGPYAAFHLGFGNLSRTSTEGGTTAGGRFTMALALGWNVNPQLRAGVELNGFLLNAGSTSGLAYAQGPDSTGSAIAQNLVVVHWYPDGARGWYLRAGAGQAQYWDRRPGALEANGTAYTVGLGWERPLDGDVALVVHAGYSWGTIADVRSGPNVATGRTYGAPEVRVGISWR